MMIFASFSRVVEHLILQCCIQSLCLTINVCVIVVGGYGYEGLTSSENLISVVILSKMSLNVSVKLIKAILLEEQI